jgi:hypothetical protein
MQPIKGEDESGAANQQRGQVRCSQSMERTNPWQPINGEEESLAAKSCHPQQAVKEQKKKTTLGWVVDGVNTPC